MILKSILKKKLLTLISKLMKKYFKLENSKWILLNSTELFKILMSKKVRTVKIYNDDLEFEGIGIY